MNGKKSKQLRRDASESAPKEEITKYTFMSSRKKTVDYPYKGNNPFRGKSKYFFVNMFRGMINLFRRTKYFKVGLPTKTIVCTGWRRRYQMLKRQYLKRLRMGAV